MALVVSTLEKELLDIFTNARKMTEIDDSVIAKQLAEAIDRYIKTAQVDPGIPVSTTGTAVAQTGATTGIGKIS